jgi:hypothetical protein
MLTRATCQIARALAIVELRTLVTNPILTHTISPIAAIVTSISVVVSVVAISHAP